MEIKCANDLGRCCIIWSWIAPDNNKLWKICFFVFVWFEWYHFINSVYFKYLDGILKEFCFDNLTNLFHVHLIIFPDYFLYIEKWLHHGIQRKSLFRFLKSLHFGSLLYFYSIFLCPPLPLGILLNPEQSPFYAQFICLLPPLPIFISKTKALSWTNSTTTVFHIYIYFWKERQRVLSFPFPGF